MEPDYFQRLWEKSIGDRLLSYPMPPAMPSINSMMLPNPPTAATMSNRFTDSNMTSMLQYRMGWNMNAPRCSFDRVNVYKLNEDKAVIFVMHSGTAQLLEDQLQLFPSDALVTQLRLLEAK